MKKNIIFILIILLFTSSIATEFIRVAVNERGIKLDLYSKQYKEIYHLLSSYFLMRGSVIYYASSNSPDSLKDNAKSVIAAEIVNQQKSIQVLDQLFKDEFKTLYDKMKNDYLNIISDVELARTSINKQEITDIVFYQIPAKRNYFRNSSEELLKQLNQKRQTSIAEETKLKNIQSYFQLLNIFFITCLMVIFLYKTYSKKSI